MSPRSAGALPLLVELDAQAGRPLHEQVYQRIHSLIREGLLSAGARLPATRVLATELDVSRNTVVTAFERLAAEGYIEGRAGGGTRVSQVLPDDMMEIAASSMPRVSYGPDRAPSRRALELAQLRIRRWSESAGPVEPFRLGAQALSHFPARDWARLARRHWARPTTMAMDYGSVAGYRPLREGIAAYLQRARGVNCDADQIIITSGSQQALDLSARVLADPGDAAWMEDPGYDGARGAMTAAGLDVVAVSIDEHGMNVAEGIQRAPRAKLAYVTPSHQFPLGITMTLARRRELLRWASGQGAWVFEDDYDSEFRYATRPLPALQGLDVRGCVIYAGTFSKVLFPSLRVGYMVVPHALLDTMLHARILSDVHPPTLAQAVLADFIAEGCFERHIRRMRSLYRERQEALVCAGRQYLDGMLDLQPANGGMHVVGLLPPGVDDLHAADVASAAGVKVTPLSFFRFSNPAPDRRSLLLGYAGLTPEQIASGAERLARALEPLTRRG